VIFKSIRPIFVSDEVYQNYILTYNTYAMEYNQCLCCCTIKRILTRINILFGLTSDRCRSMHIIVYCMLVPLNVYYIIIVIIFETKVSRKVGSDRECFTISVREKKEILVYYYDYQLIHDWYKYSSYKFFRSRVPIHDLLIELLIVCI
jgi:hypothetical protein